MSRTKALLAPNKFSASRDKVVRGKAPETMVLGGGLVGFDGEELRAPLVK